MPLASIREMAAGMRGRRQWGSLSEDLLAIDGRHDGDALGARRLIVRAAADRILEAIDRPTMLIFDDLHWTDEMSLEVIGELARHVGRSAACSWSATIGRTSSPPMASTANGGRASSANARPRRSGCDR